MVSSGRRMNSHRRRPGPPDTSVVGRPGSQICTLMGSKTRGLVQHEVDDQPVVEEPQVGDRRADQVADRAVGPVAADHEAGPDALVGGAVIVGVVRGDGERDAVAVVVERDQAAAPSDLDGRLVGRGTARSAARAPAARTCSCRASPTARSADRRSGAAPAPCRCATGTRRPARRWRPARRPGRMPGGCARPRGRSARRGAARRGGRGARRRRPGARAGRAARPAPPDRPQPTTATSNGAAGRAPFRSAPPGVIVAQRN